MQRHRLILLSLAVAGAALLVASAGRGGEPQPKTPAGGHEEVAASETCDGCHTEVTPEVVADWYAGPHGLVGVKCFVCHGAVGEGFSRQVSTERCVSCHAAQVESLSRTFLAGRDCFACHPPHRLNPHAAGAGEEVTP